MGAMPALHEPLFSNGLAFKHQANFYPLLHRAEEARVERGQCDRGGLRKSGHRWDPDLVRHRGRADHPEADERLPGRRSTPSRSIAAAPRKPGRSRAAVTSASTPRSSSHITQGGISANPPYVQLNNASINIASDGDHNEPEPLKRQDPGGYHNDQVPLTTTSGTYDNQSDPLDRQGHRPMERQLLHTLPIAIRFPQERLPQHCQLHP